jgi:transcriptional antiterminator RfaH
MPYWTVARLEPHREALAQRCLALAGFEVYLPRLRMVRQHAGRKIETRPPLFPGYAFTVIHAQWWAARWSIGVAGLIMNGSSPARVPDAVVAEIRARERGGLVELPPLPRPRPGDKVRVTAGIFTGRLALYDGMRGSERVAVLLGVLGRVVLPADAIEPVA